MVIRGLHRALCRGLVFLVCATGHDLKAIIGQRAAAVGNTSGMGGRLPTYGFIRRKDAMMAAWLEQVAARSLEAEDVAIKDSRSRVSTVAPKRSPRSRHVSTVGSSRCREGASWGGSETATPELERQRSVGPTSGLVPRVLSLPCLELRWSTRRRFDPSSSPSASPIRGAVLRAHPRPNIPADSTIILFRRIQRATSVALGRGWRMHFSPRPLYQLRKSNS
jgi:hypothetical protein